jgi:hypothetical protein
MVTETKLKSPSRQIGLMYSPQQLDLFKATNRTATMVSLPIVNFQLPICLNLPAQLQIGNRQSASTMY